MADAQRRSEARVITWRTDHSTRHGPSSAATASIPGLESIQLTHVS